MCSNDVVNLDCATCGTLFCLARPMYERRLKDGKAFFCPNGHSNVYRESTDAKRIKDLERQLEATRRMRDEWSQRHTTVTEAAHALARAAQTCPFGCGWQGNRRVSGLWGSEPNVGAFTDRAGSDLAEHLRDAHHATPQVVAGLLTSGTA